MEKSIHGGSRINSGRKSIAESDKKVALPTYPQKKMVDLIGKDFAQLIALQAIEKAYKKKLKES